MITFLFWNLKRNQLSDLITNLAHLHRVDVLILAECEISPSSLLLSLNARKTEYHYAKSLGCDKIKMFTRFSPAFIPPTSEDARTTIRHLDLPVAESILVAATHMPSRVNWSEDSLAHECTNLSRLIRVAEKKAGHTRTVLVGDLNMSPFSKGVVSAVGLHGIMDRQIAQKGKRVVQSKSYPFFYNPMWSHMGDDSSHPPGTHYYNNAEHVNYFWHMYDQVLLRPALLGAFQNKYLKILTSDGSTSLLTRNGLPDPNIASDHLPILFKLNI
jgi:hypothetical protein